MRTTELRNVIQNVKHAIAQATKSYKVRSLRTRDGRKSSGAPVVVGLMTSPTGMGEGARLIYSGLIGSGLEASYIDLTWRFLPELAQTVSFPSSPPISETGPIILHMNPSEIPTVLHLIGPDFFKGRKLIGIWAWEQDILPQNWVKMQVYFDELWAISKYMYKALSEQLSIPVFYTGYPAALLAGPETKRLPTIENNVFTVFTSFDVRSDIERKNPKASVKAFQTAFPNRHSREEKMIVKLTKSDFEPPSSWLNDPRIEIYNAAFEEVELRKMVLRSHCVISLHRSEGFGLQIAKALALGVPSVFTDYSATKEFSDCPASYPVGYKFTEANSGQGPYKKTLGIWADPDISAAAQHLRAIRQLEPNEKRQLRIDSFQWWENKHGIKSFYSRIPDCTKAYFLN